jgi:hypothetical protein
MNPEEIPDLRSDFRKHLDAVSEQIAADVLRRLREYEAEHGEVTPAGARVRISRRSSEAQTMAVMKRTLMEHGWLTGTKG